MQSIWSGPIVLKGIQTRRRRRAGRRHGVQGIALSNHGGRQLDDAPAPIELVEPVAQARPGSSGDHLRRRRTARQRHREGDRARRLGGVDRPRPTSTRWAPPANAASTTCWSSSATAWCARWRSPGVRRSPRSAASGPLALAAACSWNDRAMPLDPAIAPFLAEVEASGPPINELSVEACPARDRQHRRRSAARAPRSPRSATPRSAVCRRVVYTPHGDGPFPVLVWLHGGGWVIGGPQHYHATCPRPRRRRRLHRRVGRLPAGARPQGAGRRRRLRSPPSAGCSTTPPSSAATRTASRSVATPPVATSRRSSPSTSASTRRSSCWSTRRPT